MSTRPFETHPRSLRARLARALRRLRTIRGWERFAALLLPSCDETFVVRNRNGFFAGSLSSYIDRQVYLFGGYEELNLRAALAFVPKARRCAVLDVGANAGTHSLEFARHFKTVHAFEPNGVLWPRFMRNMELNSIRNVTLHRVGLGQQDGELPFYSIAKSNLGLGTCSPVEQYDLPLQKVGTVDIRRGDAYLRERCAERVDLVKIDVQGFEPEVLRGLRAVLARDRPYVWVEVGGGTREKAGSVAALQALFPFQSEIYRFLPETSMIFHTVRLQFCAQGALPAGDYLVAPACE